MGQGGMKAFQIRMRKVHFRRRRLIARFEHRVGRDDDAITSPFAEIIVALVSGDANEPVLERRIAPVLAELEVGLDKNVLADALELRGVAGEAAGDAEDAAFVPAREFGEGLVIPIERGSH